MNKRFVGFIMVILLICGVNVCISNLEVNASASKEWAWPTSIHSVKSDWPNYSSGRYHGGTDFPVALNSPVYSTCDGEVVDVKSLTTSYGKHIKIKATVNGTTVYMRYCHLNNFAVSVGNKVKAGQLIGYSGSTGNSTGPHLHYEVRNSNDYYGNSSSPNLNPKNYLPGTSYSFESDYASAGKSPVGCIDSVSGAVNAIQVGGWAFDEDDLNASLNIHVYIGGPAGDSNAEGHNIIIANLTRMDVHNVYGCGYNHGYYGTILTQKTGMQPVYIYAINIGSGENTLIGSATVNITVDTEAPKIEAKYLTLITPETFRVCIVPKDNVGIKQVSIATWTQSDQSDLIWHDASDNGYGTYFLDLKRSDYSKTKNSIYMNHAYIYDYAGNTGFAGIEMDYRVKSDTGQTVPAGEYRIITSVDESKALDVAEASTADGAKNIQISSNLDDSKQTFDLTYIGNGFYTIFSHNTPKSIDVEGDTYLNRTNVILCNYHGGSNQQWIIKPTEDGFYTIVARSNGLALDLAYAKTENGSNVQVHTVNDSAAQKWKLRRVLKEDMIQMKDIIDGESDIEIAANIDVVVDGEKLSANEDYHIEVTVDSEKKTALVKVTGIGEYCECIAKSVDIKSDDHTQVFVENALEATCTESGYTGDTYCKICRKLITKGEETNAIGHRFGDWITTEEASCTSEGSQSRICAECKKEETKIITKKEHDYTSEIRLATCTENGVKEFTCTVCGDSYTETTKALGHQYNDIVIEATANEKGYILHECKVCNYSYKDNYTDPIGHNYIIIETEEAKCTIDGYRRYKCSDCNDEYTVSMPATGHNYKSQIVFPTCTERGYTIHTCEKCEGSYKELFVDEKGHDYVSEITTDATCTSDGMITYTCKECKEKKTLTISAIGHNYTITTAEPTCTQKGFTVHTCQVCGESYRDAYTNEKGHHYDEGEVLRTSSCTEEGVKIYTCRDCKNQYEEMIPPLYHQYEEKVILSTCTERGYTLHTCTICKNSYRDRYSNILEHNWDSGKISAESTCTQDGILEYTCILCGEKKTKNTPRLEHEWDEGTVTKKPTDTEDGLKDYTCKKCGEKHTVEIAALGSHDIPETSEKGSFLTVGTIVEDGQSRAIYRVLGDDTVEYAKTANKKSGSIVIPDIVTLNHKVYRVTGIADQAFQNNKQVTKVMIGKNVETIGKRAFYKNTSLKKIVIPKEVKKIGSQAFSGCRKLEKIVIRTVKLTNKTVGNKAFSGLHRKAQAKVPSKKWRTYKKLLKKKGMKGKKQKIRK